MIRARLRSASGPASRLRSASGQAWLLPVREVER
jgi:hypothetical protein